MASLAAAPKPAGSGIRELEIMRATPDDTAVVAEIEKTVVGFARHDDYPWLFEHREAFLYRHRDIAIGFGFFSESSCTSKIEHTRAASKKSIFSCRRSMPLRCVTCSGAASSSTHR